MNSWIVSTLCTSPGSIEGITTDDKQNIYFSTGYKGKVCVLHNQQEEAKIIIDSTKADYRGIAWQKSTNKLFICDFKNDQIVSYDVDTGKIGRILEQVELNDPWGMIVDENEDLYFTDKNFVRKIHHGTYDHEIIAGCGAGWDRRGYIDGPARQSKFTVPSGLAKDKNGNIYVCDFSNHCIRMIKDGIVSTLAGDKDDTTASTSKTIFNRIIETFESPCGIVVDVNGTLIVCDNGKTKLRRIDLNKRIISPALVTRGTVWALHITRNGTLFVGSSSELLKVERTWNLYERYLWIGHLKEDASYCLLAGIPKEIIREIATHLKVK